MGSSSNNKCDGKEIAVTDNGNYIIDLFCTDPIFDVKAVAREIREIVGVVEHGLFIEMASTVIVAGSGGVRVAGEGGEAPWW
jgi:ribose 5-phosphate isomerase A